MAGFIANGDAAMVVGASGGLGRAIADALDARGARVLRFSRSSAPALDITDEDKIAKATDHVREALGEAPLRLVFDATGFLHDERFTPEKSWRDLSPEHMAYSYAVNAIGPALLMKHHLPLLDKERKSVFATLSAKVGGIADNRLGGWWSYRAAKAALNQYVKTASIELARKNKHAVCVSLHPGTVDTDLSAPFAKKGLDVKTPEESAGLLLDVLDGLDTDDTGGFFDYAGRPLPW